MANTNFLSTPRLVQRYAALGRDGAIGLIMTGHAFVCSEGRRREIQTSIASDAAIKGLSHVAMAAKEEGSRIFLQISHGGLCCEKKITGFQPIGPSDDAGEPGHGGRAMTLDEIYELPRLFAAAARRAQEAGFDGVQLHGAHGFLLNQFLSPLFNRRDDDYGGNQERRTRLLLEIVREIRTICGEAFPIGVKLNAEDGQEGGLMLDDSLYSATLLAAAGVAVIEVSGGLCFKKSAVQTPMRPVHPQTLQGACYFREAARRFRAALNIPVIMVGGIRNFDTAATLIDKGDADFVGLCRPLIRDPSLVRAWKRGERLSSDCRSCNRCVEASRTAAGLHCPCSI